MSRSAPRPGANPAHAERINISEVYGVPLARHTRSRTDPKGLLQDPRAARPRDRRLIGFTASNHGTRGMRNPAHDPIEDREQVRARRHRVHLEPKSLAVVDEHAVGERAAIAYTILVLVPARRHRSDRVPRRRDAEARAPRVADGPARDAAVALGGCAGDREHAELTALLPRTRDRRQPGDPGAVPRTLTALANSTHVPGLHPRAIVSASSSLTSSRFAVARLLRIHPTEPGTEIPKRRL